LSTVKHQEFPEFRCTTTRLIGALGGHGLHQQLHLDLEERREVTRDRLRCRANVAHVRQSRPDSGLRFQVKAFRVVSSSLGSGSSLRAKLEHTSSSRGGPRRAKDVRATSLAKPRGPRRSSSSPRASARERERESERARGREGGRERKSESKRARGREGGRQSESV